MKKINLNLNENIKFVKKTLGNNRDIKERMINFKYIKDKICVFYSESLCDTKKIDDFVINPILESLKKNIIIKSSKIIQILSDLVLYQSTKSNSFEDVFYNLFSGNAIIFVENSDVVLIVEAKDILTRQITEAKTDITTKGPKEAFVEDIGKNIGLVRKRLKDENLWSETIIVGRRTKTRVDLLYIKDIIDLKFVNKAMESIKNIDIDGIFDGEYIIELIKKESKTFFPTMLRTERPDITAMSLLDGKLVLLVDNSPFAVIAPSFFTDFVQAAEENYRNPVTSSMVRTIRFLGLFIFLLLPGYYISVMTHNHEAIPPDLLINFVVQREGVPFPALVEVLIMTFAFDLLNEADARLPSSMGSAISIVGALILGEASIEAGIASPITIIIVAMTSVASLALPSSEFTNALKIWQLFFMLSAATFGSLGLLVVLIIFVLRLTNIRTFGVPYLRGFAPFNMDDQKDAVIRLSRRKIHKRPSLINQKNPTRQRIVDEP